MLKPFWKYKLTKYWFTLNNCLCRVSCWNAFWGCIEFLTHLGKLLSLEEILYYKSYKWWINLDLLFNKLSLWITSLTLNLCKRKTQNAFHQLTFYCFSVNHNYAQPATKCITQSWLEDRCVKCYLLPSSMLHHTFMLWLINTLLMWNLKNK